MIAVPVEFRCVFWRHRDALAELAQRIQVSRKELIRRGPMRHGASSVPSNDELDQMTPVLRRELAFRPQAFAGKQCFVVEDPVNARFFRIGLSEYLFLCRLDGRRTLADTVRLNRGCGFSQADALAICQWAVRSGLTQERQGDAGNSFSTARHAPAAHRRGGRISPLSLQIPLFHPDRFFQRITPWLSWLFSPLALVGWLLIVGWAVCDLAVHYQRLSTASMAILSAGNWLWLGVAWLLLKMIHECGHAVACKRFRGEVREAGVIFILLAPLAYVDVTSCWRLRSKWRRIAVSAAGMYVELLLGALATLIWVRIEPGAMSQICLNVMMTASVMTLLFNANPLMRFDGYFILADLLEVPNLYASGQQFIRQFVRRQLFGVRTESSVGNGWRGIFIRVYGVASWAWRNLVFFGLVLTAATLLDGVGVVISAIAILFWLSSLVRKFIHLVRGDAAGKPDWLRFALVGGGIAMSGLFTLACVPWPGVVKAPAIVQYSGEAVVRTQCDGFVLRVLVRGGAHVEEGQVLMEMSNDILTHELAILELEIQQRRIQRRIYQRQRELAKAQAEMEQLRTLEERYVERRKAFEHLTVRAPCAGEVVGRNVDTLEGTYLLKGSHVLSIGDEAAKEVRLSIMQQNMVEFRNRTGTTVRLCFPNDRTLRSELAEVEPRASVTPLDLSLCAPFGGVLVVKSVESNRGHSPGRNYELLTPSFVGVVNLTASQGTRVRSGQRAYVALRASETIGEHLHHLVSDWVDAKLHRNQHH